MTTYYEVVVQLLRKTCEELFNCCHVACGEKKSFGSTEFTSAAKETKASTITVIVEF